MVEDKLGWGKERGKGLCCLCNPTKATASQYAGHHCWYMLAGKDAFERGDWDNSCALQLWGDATLHVIPVMKLSQLHESICSFVRC